MTLYFDSVLSVKIQTLITYIYIRLFMQEHTQTCIHLLLFGRSPMGPPIMQNTVHKRRELMSQVKHVFSCNTIVISYPPSDEYDIKDNVTCMNGNNEVLE